MERTQAEHLVQERVDDVAVLEPVEDGPAALDVLLGQAGDLRANAFAVGDVDFVGMPLHEQGVDGGLGRRHG